MAATSAGRAQAAALVQGRGLVLAEVGAALWLWWASGQAALAGWGGWVVGEVVTLLSQKHSCIKSTQFIPKALTSDKMIGRAGAEDAGPPHHDVVGSVTSSCATVSRATQ
jgi:hypothetical protein